MERFIRFSGRYCCSKSLCWSALLQFYFYSDRGAAHYCARFRTLYALETADLAGVLSRLKLALVAVLVIVGFVWWVTDEAPILAYVGMALFAWLTMGVLIEWADRLKLFRTSASNSWKRFVNLPRSAHGMTVAHLGVACMILGITASEAWQSERLGVMNPGESVNVGGYDFRFDGAHEGEGPNYGFLEGTFTVSKDGDYVTVLTPSQRQYSSPPMETTEAAILPMISADLYAVIGKKTVKAVCNPYLSQTFCFLDLGRGNCDVLGRMFEPE